MRGEFVEHLHRLEGLADAILLNPGAWTHYRRGPLRDALELERAFPAVEVHLSRRRPPRGMATRCRSSGGTCASDGVVGKGPDGYRDALEAAEQGADDMKARAEASRRAARRSRCVDVMADHEPRQRPGYLTGYTG